MHALMVVPLSWDTHAADRVDARVAGARLRAGWTVPALDQRFAAPLRGRFLERAFA